jgi:putative transposase
MSESTSHRKQIKHFHDPGDVHELTFSCYRRMKLLSNNCWRGKLSTTINEACKELNCNLACFVYMPEHVHLLIWGLTSKDQLGPLLKRIKKPFSDEVRVDLETAKSPLLNRLMIRERPGKQAFRFWQEGPGYDRNLCTTKSVQASLDYIHQNPVRRGLCVKATDWRWSSAKHYESEGKLIDPALPKITPLPAAFWS